jgi:hypothetical protein
MIRLCAIQHSQRLVANAAVTIRKIEKVDKVRMLQSAFRRGERSDSTIQLRRLSRKRAFSTSRRYGLKPKLETANPVTTILWTSVQGTITTSTLRTRKSRASRRRTSSRGCSQWAAASSSSSGSTSCEYSRVLSFKILSIIRRISTPGELFFESLTNI